MKEKTVFTCAECGYKTSKWLGKCPSCGKWNSFEEKLEIHKKAGAADTAFKSGLIKLFDAKVGESSRLVTNISEYNRVSGGGIVRDSLTILSSPPGGGKSTLSLMLANDCAKAGLRVLYASGEESVSQIKARANRILDNISENIWILSDNSMDNVISAVNDIDPDLIVIDSIQTFALSEFYPARAGNPTQSMACAGELLKLAKGDRKRAVIIIGQMNKNDELAGLRALEHLVDTVLIMYGEDEGELRSIYATKNRFGKTGETGFFAMTEKGFVSIDDPSEFFITKRDKGEEVSGSAVTVLKEGSRPVIAEIESLVSPSFTPYPSRICEAMRQDNLNILISVLEQRCKINMFNKNVVIKTTGGIRLKEQGANLAVAVSILSSLFDKPLPEGTAFIGDIGLTAEIKKVPYTEIRIKELDRMGYRCVFVPAGSKRPEGVKIKILEAKNLNDVIKMVFGKNI